MPKNYNSVEEPLYPQKIYASQLITIDDLEHFKKRLLDDLLSVLKVQQTSPAKKWMKSHEVRRLLKISPGTLQSLKANGVIPYSKIGGVHYFEYAEIEKVMQGGKVSGGGIGV
ncbi:DNA-binding protein [Segetibacter sp. 3557_3]|uniref:helix-turn-helix domain-containing protein n=1 Tax=Segetibacter sp. 3557_3 TaxID=2547429 RepID=UPI0010586EA5|nr:helix-turn-helix domain-containing protein [Segetibacter sp. 3557_3]TDH18482.1 DNA-binding protein [Segetibacter sp. 3557_3]